MIADSRQPTVLKLSLKNFQLVTDQSLPDQARFNMLTPIDIWSPEIKPPSKGLIPCPCMGEGGLGSSLCKGVAGVDCFIEVLSLLSACLPKLERKDSLNLNWLTTH